MNPLSALWVILSVQTQLVAGLPLTTVTEPTAVMVGWVSDAPTRGTLSIITSCALTMGLCVWSALHLNIPSKRHSLVQFWLRNVTWMLTGLLAPELVVFAAWKQYVSARTLQHKINGLASSRAKLPTVTDPKLVASRDKSDWTIVHSFYAGMGGFVFDLTPASASALPLSKLPSRRLTLTPRGVGLLAECGLLPEISREDIGDKSKADNLAKGLVCLQAGWMMMQAVGRIAYGLPVTLLEINTIGHVICAFVIYVLWWHKPKLVHEPTPLRGDWTEAVCAYMWMSSRMSDPCWKETPVFGRQAVPELAKLAFYPANDVRGLSCLEPTPKSANGNTKSDVRDSVVPVTDSKDYLLPPSPGFAYKDNFGYLGPIAQQRSVKSTAEALNEASLPSLEHDTPPERWRLVLDAMHKFPAISTRLNPNKDKTQDRRYRLNTEELLQERAGNWHSPGLLSNFRGLVMGMALWLASMAFGGVHAAAWNGYFPSTLERRLWRFCSVYIMASGLLWLCINFFGQLSRSFDNYWEKILARRASWPTYVILGFLCTICGLVYGFARIFLITEAVISLRRLPAAAYNTPDWSQMIPHL